MTLLDVKNLTVEFPTPDGVKAERARIIELTKLFDDAVFSFPPGVADISDGGQEMVSLKFWVRKVLIGVKETLATYPHIITYHSTRVSAKMAARRVPHFVVPPGNSWTLFAVFA